MTTCTYAFTNADGERQVITGQAAFKAYLLDGGLQHLLPSFAARMPSAVAAPAFSTKQDLNDRLKQKIFSDFDAAVREYSSLPGTKNGKLLDTDQARELSDEYRADRSLAPKVHEAASAFTQRAFETRMAESPDGGLVMFMAGGGGAGKSSAEYLLGAEMDRAGTILDGTLSSYDKAARNVQLALDNNQSVIIAYVYREPVEAMRNGVLTRAMKRGRTVTIDAVVKGHAGSSGVVRRLEETFGNNPNFLIKVIDNSHGPDGAVVSTLEAVPVVEHEGLKEKLRNATDEEFKAGRISEVVHKSTTSPYDTRQTNGVEGQAAGNEPGNRQEVRETNQPGEPRYAVSRAGQKNPAASRINYTNADRFKRTEALQQGVTDLQEGKITLDEYNRMVDELRPVYPYAEVPAVTTPKDARYALSTGKGQSPEKAAKYGLPSMTLSKGDWAQLRLDIPSYQIHDAWVVSVHTPKSTNREVQAAYDAGTVIGYESVAAMTDVTFGMNQRAATKIAQGTSKGTIATMLGKWSPISKEAAKARADAALNDPDWTQVGMDPFRHSYFYDRDSMRPVLSADEVIQIGPLVLAKNVKFAADKDITGAPIMFSAKQDLPVDVKLERWAKSIFDKLGNVSESKIIADSLPHPALSMGPGVALGDRQMVVLDGHALDHAAKHVEEGITARMIGQLPAALKDPRMINFQGPGQALVMLPIRAKNGAPVVVALKKEEIKGGGTSIKVTRFATTYPLDNSASYIVREIEKGNRMWLPSEEVSRLRDLLGKLNATQPQSAGPGVTQTLALPLKRGGNQAVKEFIVLSDAALAKKQAGEKGWEKETETISIPTNAAKDLKGVAFSQRQPVGKETDSWVVSRDALGRLRFGAGAKAYRYVGDVANDILEKTPLIGSLKPVSPELSRYMRQMKVEVAKARNLTVDVAKNLQELPEDERQMISDVIEGQLAFGVIPPKRVLELAASMQALMTEQSTELVRLGMLSKEAAGRWDGQYLPRFYEQTLKSEAAGWVKAAKALLGRQKTMQGIGGSSLKSRGLFQTINVEDLNDWLAEGWEVRDAKFDSAKHDVITVWRDYTKDERENMGEIRDAMFRFVMGYNRSQRDIALGRLYERIATDIASRNEKPGFVQVPATKVEDTNAKRYGALADMWVPQEVLDQLSSNDEAMQGELLKLYRAGLSKWKEGKTVLNPVAHVNNVVSNVTMAHFAGVSYWDGHKYFGALKDLVNNSDMVKEAKDAGLFLGTFNQEELINMLPDELKVLAGKTESQAAKIGNLAWNIASLGLRKPLAAAYEGEDLYFRYLIYRDARQRGLEVQDAVDYAQKYIFTYDDLPKGARTIRDAPIGIPFFSWSYKAMPVLAQTLAEHPHRFAGPAAILAAVNAMGYAIAAGASGGDGDDDWWKLAQRYIMDPEFRAQANGLEKEERKNLPEWQKGLSIFGTPKVVRLGMDELTGLPLFLDISRMFPGGDMGDFTNNAGGLPLPSWLTPNSPVFSTLSALLANKDLFTAKEVVSPKLDTAAEKSQKWGEWAYKQAAPAVAPFNYHFDRVMNALANATGKDIDLYFREYTGTDKMGQPVQAKYAAMQTVGIKVRPTDLDVSEQMANSERKKLIAEIDKQIKAVHRGEGRGFYTPKRADELVERLRTKKENLKEGLTVGGSEKD